MSAVWTVHHALGTREHHAIYAKIRQRIVGVHSAPNVRGVWEFCGGAGVATHHKIGARVESRVAVGAEAPTAIFTVSAIIKWKMDKRRGKGE